MVGEKRHDACLGWGEQSKNASALVDAGGIGSGGWDAAQLLVPEQRAMECHGVRMAENYGTLSPQIGDTLILDTLFGKVINLAPAIVFFFFY